MSYPFPMPPRFREQHTSVSGELYRLASRPITDREIGQSNHEENRRRGLGTYSRSGLAREAPHSQRNGVVSDPWQTPAGIQIGEPRSDQTSPPNHRSIRAPWWKPETAPSGVAKPAYPLLFGGNVHTRSCNQGGGWRVETLTKKYRIRSGVQGGLRCGSSSAGRAWLRKDGEQDARAYGPPQRRY